MAPRRLIKPIEKHVVGSIVAIYLIVLIIVVGGFAKVEHQQSEIEQLVKQNHRLIVLDAKRTSEITKVSKASDYKICVRVNNLNSLIVQTLQRQKRATYRISFYEQNPDLRRQAIKEINRELKTFAPARRNIPKKGRR